MVICIICGKELSGRQMKYCSKVCADKSFYRYNKDTYKSNAIRWSKENPEKSKEMQKKAMLKHSKTDKFRESMKRYYYKNRDKNMVRSTGNYHRGTILNHYGNKCMKCNSVDKLEIHHLDYTWDVYYKGFNNLKLNIDKVKVLCRGCHKKHHKKEKVFK